MVTAAEIVAEFQADIQDFTSGVDQFRQELDQAEEDVEDFQRTNEEASKDGFGLGGAAFAGGIGGAVAGAISGTPLGNVLGNILTALLAPLLIAMVPLLKQLTPLIKGLARWMQRHLPTLTAAVQDLAQFVRVITGEPATGPGGEPVAVGPGQLAGTVLGPAGFGAGVGAAAGSIVPGIGTATGATVGGAAGLAFGTGEAIKAVHERGFSVNPAEEAHQRWVNRGQSQNLAMLNPDRQTGDRFRNRARTPGVNETGGGSP